MSEGLHLPFMEDNEVTQAPDRFAAIAKIVRNEALIEAEPSMQLLDPNTINAEPGGSIYYGTGLTTPRAISIGLPFDVLGMMLTAEKVRRAGQFDQVYHHIADTHAKTNDWIDPAAVDEVAARTVDTLEQVKRNLGLDHFQFVRSSSFDHEPDYEALVQSFDSSEEHEYVRREMADMEWYRTRGDVRIKMGWIIQAKETAMGFDERRFDREYLRFHPGQMSFIYTKPGRTFDPSRPKASPYISVAGEGRLLLAPGVNVHEVFTASGDPNLGGAKKHLENVVRAYEGIFGSLGKIGTDGVTFEGKIQHIIDKCFAS
ncbi:MAG TPA: hypothetical protein VLF91_00350 [Candidatus Saccharimonadales bacterium]|nr:hypothetical protein [Candidatus Saccharimonadales bacterium]